MGSGVLPGFAGFWGVFGGFAFAFANLIFGSGGGLVFGWAMLGWAVFLLLWILGTAGGFCFLLLPFVAGLGSAGLPLGLAGLGSPHARFRENSKRNENAIRSETHTISIYPALEGLGFRV